MSNHREVLGVLGGLRIRSIGRAADLLWMHFGEYQTIADRRGGSREVGEWALHVQCPWRFVHNETIPLSSRDYYFYPEGDREYDWEECGESLFDRRASQMDRMFEEAEFRVTNISVGSCGAFQLDFSPDFHFAVFPHASNNSPECEFWRLFRPSTNEAHYVVSNEGTESV